ncbi:hypothetical protein NDU88_004704 [Pleurodeles waltl]|uniref:Uncharacterized protein n=1 Tax=Pleurodeles waltl TaxID=8319 RepID=A0AAV7L262_PLEWA|nr:hypothetical protein NDU88_004704 [Pleurodeles waltl]
MESGLLTARVHAFRYSDRFDNLVRYWTRLISHLPSTASHSQEHMKGKKNKTLETRKQTSVRSPTVKKDLLFHVMQGGIEHLKEGTGQLDERPLPPGLLQWKPCLEGNTVRKHHRNEEESNWDRQGEAALRADNEVEGEKEAHPHYYQDKEAEMDTETKEVLKTWCEDWWTRSVEAPEPVTTVESCGYHSELRGDCKSCAHGVGVEMRGAE